LVTVGLSDAFFQSSHASLPTSPSHSTPHYGKWDSDGKSSGGI